MAVLVLLAAAEAVETVVDEAPAQATDAVQRAEARWSAVRGELEAKGVRGVVGYDDGLAPAALEKDAAAVERYYRAQFALVPCVLSPAVREGWVVVDLPDDEP